MAEEHAGLIVRWVAAAGKGHRFARTRLLAVVVELQAWNCRGQYPRAISRRPASPRRPICVFGLEPMLNTRLFGKVCG